MFITYIYIYIERERERYVYTSIYVCIYIYIYIYICEYNSTTKLWVQLGSDIVDPTVLDQLGFSCTHVEGRPCHKYTTEVYAYPPTNIYSI